MITDVRPGTIPAWAIRVAHKDGEWLVLSDLFRASEQHRCDLSGLSIRRGWKIGTFQGEWAAGGNVCACAGPWRGWTGRRVLGRYDTLAEAQAAFTALEEAWLRE